LKRKILLTGATGFVGRQILKFLQDKDVDIILVVRKGWQKKIINRKNVTSVFLTKDLFGEDVKWWTDACSEVDVVIHAAWYAEPGRYLLSDKNIDCLQGTINIAKGAVFSDVKKIVGIGTCFEYDLTQGLLSINTPLKPLTPYAASKTATYLALEGWLTHKKVDFSWCRLFYLFGEGEDCRRLVPYIKSKLKENKQVELTSGNQIRDFMDVSDAGRLITEISLGKDVGPINICSGIPITVRQFAEDIASAYDRKDLLRFGARSDNFTDPPCVVGVCGGIDC
jgi:nucleoside-diphosphate-sugar epimerase